MKRGGRSRKGLGASPRPAYSPPITLESDLEAMTPGTHFMWSGSPSEKRLDRFESCLPLLLPPLRSVISIRACVPSIRLAGPNGVSFPALPEAGNKYQASPQGSVTSLGKL